MRSQDSKINESEVPRGPTTNSDCQQFGTAAILLGQALLRFMERSNGRIAEKVLEKLIPIVSQLTQIETQQKQSNFRLDSIEKTLGNLSSHSKLLENASQTNQLLGKQHYENYVVQPMVRSLFAVIDIIEDACKSWEDDQDRTNQYQAELLDAIRTQLQQFLVNYGIEIVRHPPNSQFNPQLMKPVSKVSTSNKELDGLMARSLQSGFRWNQQRLLRPESVSIYKFVRTHINPIKQENGGVS